MLPRCCCLSIVWLCGALLCAIGFGTGCARKHASEGDRATVRISQRNEPADLDPATASLPDEFFIIRALAEGLLVPNPNGGAPLPGAAERYDVSPDGLIYTFHLRTTATWSNGEPITADDFVQSYKRMLSPATGAPKAHLYYAVRNAREFATGATADFGSVGIVARDPHTLVVTLQQPLANFPLYVTSGAWIPVNPRVVAQHGRKWTQAGNHVGNGPFTLVEWRSQQRIVVRRNSHYHGAAQVPADGLEFIRFDSQDTEERAFRAGQVDVTMAVPQTKLEVYTRDRPAELKRAALAETRFVTFNTQRAPLSDARVRRALSLAIDRGQIVQHVLRGGQAPADRFLSPALFGTSPAVPVDQAELLSHDAAAARRLLAEAGFPNGRGFPRLELAGWVQNPVLEAIQQMWKQELGIEVAIVVQEAKVHLAALQAGHYDIGFVTNLLDVLDPAAALADFTTGAPNNFPQWRSPAFDAAVERSVRAGPAEAARDIQAAESLLLREAVVAPVYFNTQNYLVSPRVRGWQQDPIWSRRYNDLHLARP